MILPRGGEVWLHVTGGGLEAYAWRYGPAVRLGYGSADSAARALLGHVATLGGSGKPERCGGCRRSALLTAHGACAACHAEHMSMCRCAFCVPPEQGNRGPDDPGACQPGAVGAVPKPRDDLSGSGEGVFGRG